jgi:cyclophilin family peptidyl-prolyl cis-trans isomerase
VVEARAPTLPSDYVLHPSSSDLRAPERALVAIDTTKGRILVEIERAMAERAADRFYTLVVARFFDGTTIGETTASSVAFAPHTSLDVRNVWYMRRLAPESRARPNTRGTITLVGVGHRGRATDVVINLADAPDRDAAHATPFGKLRALDVATQLRAGDTIRSARLVEERL